MKKITITLLLLIGTLSITNAQWQQIGEDIDGETYFELLGSSISLCLDGTIIAIGAQYNDDNYENSGQVRIFEKQDNEWEQIGQDINGEEENDRLGNYISINSDGSIVAISGFGIVERHVRIYENIGNTWVQIGEDISTNNSIVKINSDGSVVVTKGIDDDGIAFVSIFENQNNEWVQIGGNIPFESSPLSISINSEGSIIAIGSIETSFARVYENQNNSWIQIGNDIYGREEYDFFGQSSSLSSDGLIIALGTIDGNGLYYNSGYVRICKLIGDTWEQIGDDISGEVAYEMIANSISLSSDGSKIAIGSYASDQNEFYSLPPTRIYENQNNTWTKIGEIFDEEHDHEEVFSDVCLSGDGNTVAMSNYSANNFYGHVRIYSNGALSVQDTHSESSCNIYPNPALDYVIITNNTSEKINVEILDLGGQICIISPLAKENKIDISILESGIYFVKVREQIQKLIIE